MDNDRGQSSTGWCLLLQKWNCQSQPEICSKGMQRSQKACIDIGIFSRPLWSQGHGRHQGSILTGSTPTSSRALAAAGTCKMCSNSSCAPFLFGVPKLENEGRNRTPTRRIEPDLKTRKPVVQTVEKDDTWTMRFWQSSSAIKWIGGIITFFWKTFTLWSIFVGFKSKRTGCCFSNSSSL